MADTRDWRRNAEPSGGGATTPLGFRLRADLRVLRESVDDGNRINVRVVDPVNGKHYSFNEQEFFLCEAADGASTPQSIADRYQERFGQAITPRELRSFYRRLKIFGLTEAVSSVPEDAGPRSGRGGEEHAARAGDEPGDRPAWGAGDRQRGGGQGAARLLGAMSSEQDPGALIRALIQARSGAHPGEQARSPVDDGRLHSLWLFTPAKLFTALYILFYPAKFLYWLVWPGALLAGLTIFQRWDDFALGVLRVSSSVTAFSMLVITLLAVNLVSRLVQGTVITRASGQAPRLGMTLVFGLLPHFIVDTSMVRTLDKRSQLRCYAAGVVARLTLFVLGTLAWAFLRHTGTLLPEAALLIGQAGLTAFLISAMPLFMADGQKWLAVRLDEPRLRGKALRALKARLGGEPLKDGEDAVSAIALAFFGAGMVLATLALALQFLVITAMALETQFRGPGVIMFLCLFASFILYVLALYAKTRKSLARQGGRGLAAVAGGGAEALGAGAIERLRRREPMVPDADADDDAEHLGAKIYSGARLFWSVLLVAALAVAFLPYDYETGGSFRVLPVEQQSVAVRTDGEVTEIFVREGDWVEAGQLLAQLSPWDEERDLAVTLAQLEKAKATLADLEIGPKPEQIALAQRQVESARAGVAFSKAELDRAEYLYKTGSGSLQVLEKTRTTYDQTVADLNVALANLDLVKSGATEPELEAARAEVRRLAHDVDYKRDQLERTRVRAPTAGRVITPNVHLLAGKYLTNGQPFVDVEDTRVVQVEIEVPETDLEQVQIGDDVRIRPWSFTDRIIAGAVSGIAPAVEAREFGEIVRVNADIPNEEGELKSGMTGYAKIAGSEMPVWRAYLSLFVRFFRVEVWSWIP